MKILFATNNPGKLLEVKSHLTGLSLEIIIPKDLETKFGSPPDPEETSETYEGNSLIKARQFYEWCGIPVFADDSGIEVEILNGGPGVHSSRFAAPDPSHKKHRDKMIAALKAARQEYSLARYCSTICLFGIEQKPIFFTATLEGKIIDQEKGEGGFGYDKIFVPAGYDLTSAELKEDNKQPKTHRIKALEQMFDFFKNHPNYADLLM
ncbi:MAG: hypothetical protein KDD56_03960 [Bdellovibrionales bacterium]|nr:hypothetical protein [Bdellovibrionales bacterium]